jgi:hypothetical protein
MFIAKQKKYIYLILLLKFIYRKKTKCLRIFLLRIRVGLKGLETVMSLSVYFILVLKPLLSIIIERIRSFYDPFFILFFTNYYVKIIRNLSNNIYRAQPQSN